MNRIEDKMYEKTDERSNNENSEQFDYDSILGDLEWHYEEDEYPRNDEDSEWKFSEREYWDVFDK